MRRTEDPHHTPEQVAAYIEQGQALIDAADVDDRDRHGLLQAVVTLLAAKQIFYEQAMPVPDLAALTRTH